jgi:copper chaperone
MKQEIIQISGMTCNHCKSAVENIIRAEGITEFEVNLSTGKAVLTAEETRVKQVIQAINDTEIYKASQS